MSNADSAGMVKLAKGWKWVDFGMAERKEGDVILRLTNRDDGGSRRRVRTEGWVAEVVKPIDDDDEVVIKRWYLPRKSAWVASIEVNVQHPHIAPNVQE